MQTRRPCCEASNRFFLQGIARTVELHHVYVVSAGVLVPSNSSITRNTSPAAETIPLAYTGAKALGGNGSWGLIIFACIWLQLAEHHASLHLASLPQQTGCIL